LMLATLHGVGMKVHCLSENRAPKSCPGAARSLTERRGPAGPILRPCPRAKEPRLLDVLKASGETVGDDFAQILAEIEARGRGQGWTGTRTWAWRCR